MSKYSVYYLNIFSSSSLLQSAMRLFFKAPENGVNGTSGELVIGAPNTSGPSCDTATDNGPANSPSSDEEPVNPAPRRCHRRRTPRSEPGNTNSSPKDKPAVVRKPPRAKSQPPVSTKENQRPSSRLDWTEIQVEVMCVFVSVKILNVLLRI